MRRLNRDIILSLLLAVITALVYVSLILYCRCTVLITRDGIWKSYELLQYVYQGGLNNPEKANAIYIPLLASVWQLLHLAPQQVHLLIAFSNAIAGGLSVAAVYFIVRLLQGTPLIAVLTALFQFACGSFMAQCTSCNDIMPAYCLGTWCLYFFFKYLSGAGGYSLLYAAICYALALLLHWTIALPLATGLVAGFIFSSKGLGAFLRSGIYFSLVVLIALALAAFSTHTTVWQILMPGKGLGSLWVGWSTEKMCVEAVNSLSFLMPAYVYPKVSDALKDPRSIHLLSISGAVYVFIFLFFTFSAFRNNGSLLRKIYGVLLTMLVTGSFMASYDQGYDPQFIIQPMFFFVIGAGVFFIFILPGNKGWGNI
ncbi:MAG TPA: hypothetical protein VG603_10460, partial [Chitinophagales bacterium]|nr:hypothetical protein [Chitinophagales bacterium]